MRRLVLLAAATAVLGATAVPTFAEAPLVPRCSDRTADVLPLAFPVAGETAQALYALPDRKPRGIVVFDHGYGHTMHSWTRHLARTAAELDVIAVAPDYRGQVDTPDPDGAGPALPKSRGWRVAEGAEDTIAVAQLFDDRCRPNGLNVVHGVSMGGNTSGLVLAAQPTDRRGEPLFDHWVDVEGAANVTETYLAARALAVSGNDTAENAVADIEEAFGGPIEEVPEVYADRTVIARADDIAASGVRSVVMVHGVADGLVSHDHSRQLQAELRALGVPVDFWSAVTRTPDSEPGTTVDGYVPSGQRSPFAGHASESSETHVVGLAGFAALARLYAGEPVTCAETVFDGMTGQTVPVPTTGC